jgi:hypothetical protein
MGASAAAAEANDTKHALATATLPTQLSSCFMVGKV